MIILAYRIMSLGTIGIRVLAVTHVNVTRFISELLRPSPF